MNCRQFTELAAAWLDGELPPERRAEAEEHLAGCPECSRLAEDLAAADRALAAVPAAGRSEAEWEAFNRKLMVRIAMDERSRSAGTLVRRRRLWRGALKAAAAAAALILAGWAGYLLRPAPPVPPSTGTVGTADLDSGPSALDPDRRAEFGRLLAAAEHILLRLSNADPKDREELAAIRSAVIDTGLPARLAEARRGESAPGPALADARPVEMVLVRVANGSPAEPAEFAEIKSLVLDAALVERTRSLRKGM